MNGVSITIFIKDSGTADALRQVASKLANLTPVMKQIGSYVLSSTQLRFRGQHGPDGTPWKPSRRAIREGGQTLVKTASSGLLGSLAWSASQSSAIVGTNKKYAVVHQFGFDGTVQIPAHTRRVTTAFGRKLKTPVTANVRAHPAHMRIVARPFLGINADDEAEIRAIITDFLTGGK